MGDEANRRSGMFNLFASERFVITTYLTGEEIRQRLDTAIDPYSFRLLLFGHKPYKGRISADGFLAERIFYDGGAPMVTGQFWNDGVHTLIDVRIAQQPWTIIRMFLGLAGCIGFFIIFPSLSGTRGAFAFFALIAIFTLIAVFVIIPMYTREVGRSKRFFRALLEDISEG